MSLYDFFWGLGTSIESGLSSLYDDNVGLTTFFNTSVLLLGFVGLFYWLRFQIKANKKAQNNPDQRK